MPDPTPLDPIFDLLDDDDPFDMDDPTVLRSAMTDLLQAVMLELTLLADRVEDLTQSLEQLKSDVRYLMQSPTHD